MKTDTTTAAKVIEEINEIDTETNLSLEIISGISEKDSEKLNELSDNNKENIDKLTEKAVESAKSTKEDSELIAKVVSVASDDLANKVVEEVSKNSQDEKESLSAKVLNEVVKIKPDKFEIINQDLQQTIIDQAISASKNQAEGNLEDSDDLSNTLAEIVTKAEIETSSKLINTLSDTTDETDSKVSFEYN